MAAIYEVWDTETFNRVGTFPTEVEAETFLHDVLRVNGREVARVMTILAYRENSDEPVVVLTGEEFLAKHHLPV